MYIFGLLVFILVVVGLFCQYHSQVIGWKDSSPKCVEWDVKLYALTMAGNVIIDVASHRLRLIPTTGAMVYDREISTQACLRSSLD